MKRFGTTLLAMAALLLAAAPAALAADAVDDGVTVMVMKHACNEDVRSLQDFNAIKEQGAADNGAAGALAATVLACPTIVNPGDDQSDGVAGEPIEFEFEIEDANGTHQQPSNTMTSKLCETDLGIDATGDGNISADVCLDTTHYVFENIASGHVWVRETSPPAGFTFGELLFTPSELDGNNDADTLVSIDRDAGVIELDTSLSDDGMVMLHVYNFQIQMPDSSTAPDASPAGPANSLGLLLAIGLVAGIGAWLTLGQRRRQLVARNED